MPAEKRVLRIKMEIYYGSKLGDEKSISNALRNLDKLDNWPDKVKVMQSNWIGKSIGAEIDFKIHNNEKKITVFTTRPDTIFGATFVAISIDHDLAVDISTENDDLKKFIKDCESLNYEKAKRGFNTGFAVERLKHKEDMIRSQIETNEAVRSNYEDADFAKEQMELMKVQILQQTATAALAQANSAPQSVLSLFR